MNITKLEWNFMAKKAQVDDDVDKNTLLVGKISSTEQAKKMCKEKFNKLPRPGYEIIIDNGLIDIDDKGGLHSKAEYRTHLQNNADTFRVWTWIDVSPYTAKEAMGKKAQTESQESQESQEPQEPREPSVAKIILQQLGGNKFIAMTGARNFLNLGNGLSFRLPGSGFTKQGINYVNITLDPSDTYTIEFRRIRGSKNTIISTHNDIYYDVLQEVFTRVTGLETHL